jgi:anti-sigma factor ChrR (cupin superfamily)
MKNSGWCVNLEFAKKEVKKMRMTVTAIFIVAILALTGSVLAKNAESMEENNATTPVFIPASDLKWSDLDPVGAPGVKVVDLWGDHQKGPFGALFKLPAGFAVPLHTHTHTMKVVFLSGTYIQAPEGKSEVRLGPGSYMLQPGGNYRHVTSCDPASECVFFVESKGAFDLKPVVVPKQ